MSSDSNLVGDHPWLGGTTYGAVDSPAGPSMAAIDSPAGSPMAAKFAVDGPAGPVVGGTIGGVTDLSHSNAYIFKFMTHPFLKQMPHSTMHCINVRQY